MLSYFRPAYQTKQSGVDQKLVRVVSVDEATLGGKTGKYANGHQTTSLLINPDM